MIQFHQDAFAIAMAPLESCVSCGGAAQLTPGRMWWCPRCRMAWLNGYARFHDPHELARFEDDGGPAMEHL